MFLASSMPDTDWWNVLWSSPKRTIESLELQNPVAVAIDLCCGNGLFTGSLADIAGRVYCVELSAELIEEAKKTTELAGVTNKCHWIIDDAMHLGSVIPEQADIILMANTFHGIPNKQEMVRIMINSLSPTGEIVIINWHKRPREDTTVLDKPRGPQFEFRMSPDEVQAFFRPFGFFPSKIVDVSPFHYGIVFKKEGTSSK